jgi:hypothetical protein
MSVSAVCTNQHSVTRAILINPFEAEARLNNIWELSPYLKENTTLHHYKDQLVNAV